VAERVFLFILNPLSAGVFSKTVSIQMTISQEVDRFGL